MKAAFYLCRRALICLGILKSNWHHSISLEVWIKIVVILLYEIKFEGSGEWKEVNQKSMKLQKVEKLNERCFEAVERG